MQCRHGENKLPQYIHRVNFFPSRSCLPPRTYTDQEKEELGVEDEDDYAEIQVGRLLELAQVGRVTECRKG